MSLGESPGACCLAWKMHIAAEGLLIDIISDHVCRADFLLLRNPGPRIPEVLYMYGRFHCTDGGGADNRS